MGRIHRTLVTCPTVPTWTMDLGPNHGWNGQVVSCLQFVTASLESFLLRRSHRLVSAHFLFYTGTSRILWVRSTHVCFFHSPPFSTLSFPPFPATFLFSYRLPSCHCCERVRQIKIQLLREGCKLAARHCPDCYILSPPMQESCLLC